MLKKLRIKFIIVIMAVVTVMFAAIFTLVLHLTKQNIERDSLQMMRAMSMRMPDDGPRHRPDSVPDKLRLPFFTVQISGSGEITATGGDFFDLTDQTVLSELVRTVDEAGGQTGIIPDYNLRFMKNDGRNTKSIIFADISSEKSILRGFIRNSVIIGLIGYAVFFVISLLLSKWVTRPVEKTWNEQKQFIANASHELKTPLTVIMTNAEMMEEQAYSEQDRAQFSQNILATSKRMRRLVESLLELARLDCTQTPVPHKAVDLSKLISDCILPFEPLFFENAMQLSADIEPGITVQGNKDQLRQVTTILLDNALKYSDTTESVTVTLKRQTSGCVLCVSGHGTPLTKEACKDIFKRFYRVDEARSDGRSYGLGLSIAESIIREHSGKIWAESENGRNSFRVSLPD